MNKILLIPWVFTSLVWAQPREVTYRLSMTQPWTHILEVEIGLNALSPESAEVDLVLPVWRSGRYQILDFASGVVQFNARASDGRTLRWRKVEKNVWRVSLDGSQQIRVDYAVYANEFELRTRGLNAEHAFVDGSAVFMYCEKYRRAPVSLVIAPYGSWHVTTGLDSVPGERFRFRASSYDHLVDCPLEIGNQTDREALIEGVPHVISVFGPLNCNMDSLESDIRRVVRSNREFWGDLPYRRYVFLFEALDAGSGGTEHLNSSVLQVGPPPKGGVRPWRDLLGLISHEFFHTWNVKQLRPRGMDPYDWTRENYYRELWFAEGGTTYFHGLLLRRAGFSTPRQYLDGLAAAISSDRERPGNTHESVVECSFDAWLQWRLSPEAAYSYRTDLYGRGASVCALLDLEIRRQSGNQHSLEEVLKLLYKRFPLGSGGYTVEDLQRTAEESSGTDLKDLFDGYVSGARPIEWERVLLSAGLQLLPEDSVRKSWLGVEVVDDSGHAVVRHVAMGSPGSKAGILVGDDLLDIDGRRVDPATLMSLIASRPLGSIIRLSYAHQGRQRVVDVALDGPAPQRYQIKQVSSATPLQKSIYESWLGAAWGLLR